VADNLQFVLELVDKMTSNATRISGALEDIHKKLDAISENSERTTGATEGLGESFAIFDLAKDGIEELVSKFVELGEEIVKDTFKAAEFERISSIQFKGMLGDAGLAKDAMDQVKQFANATGTTFEHAKQLFSTGIMGGLKVGNKLTDMMGVAQFAQDIEVLSNHKHSADSIVEMFARIQLKGMLAGRELRQFTRIGVNVADVAKKLGLSLGGGAEGMNKSVSAATALKTIMDSFAHTGGRDGGVGFLSVEAGAGIEGSMNRLHNAWDSLIGKFGETKAFTHIIELLRKVTNALDPSTESGKKFAEMFEHAFQKLDQFLAPLLKGDEVSAKMSKFADVLGTVGSAVLKVADALNMAVYAWKEFSELAGAHSIGTAEKGAPDDFLARFVKGNLPMHAEGGIFTTPHIGMVAEAGPEAIIPLGKSLGDFGGGGTVVNASPSVHQTFHISAEPGMTVHDLAQEIARIAAGELQPAFDTFAAQMGEAA
jgi:hypothetical protein